MSASSSSLSTVVSGLVRASMGSSVSGQVTDEDLDRHVAELILKEAKQKAERYAKEGVRAYTHSPGPDSNAPRTDKRFLTSIIQRTDGHNKNILRAQAAAAQEIKREREEKERRERRARAEEAVAAAKMSRGEIESRYKPWDLGKRKLRGWEDDLESEPEKKHRHEDDRQHRRHRSRSRDSRHHRRRSRRSNSRSDDDRHHHRRDSSRREGNSHNERSPRREHGSRSSHRQHSSDREDNFHEESSSRRHSSRRERSPRREHSSRSSHKGRSSRREHSSEREDNSHAESSPRREHSSRGSYKGSSSHREHSSEKMDNSHREPSSHPEISLHREPSQHIESAKSTKDDTRKYTPKRSLSPPAKASSSTSVLSCSPAPAAVEPPKKPSISHSPGPSKLKSLKSTSEVTVKYKRKYRNISRSPTPDPFDSQFFSDDEEEKSKKRSKKKHFDDDNDSNNEEMSSKMDKYFSPTYDPRLDVAPLVSKNSTTGAMQLNVPATGLVSDAEFAGWDAMLEVIRARREDKEEKKLMEKLGISKPKDKKSKKVSLVGSAAEAGASGAKERWGDEGVSIMDIAYQKKGSVREWDKGKDASF